jgi:hypothetical protein
MEQSKFARATSKSETASEVVSLTAHRSKKSSAAIVKALQIVQAAETAIGICSWSPADELTAQTSQARAKVGARKLSLVRQVTEQERIAKFAKRMFAITGDAGYRLAFSAQ